jgi:hypothetical protein
MREVGPALRSGWVACTVVGAIACGGGESPGLDASTGTDGRVAMDAAPATDGASSRDARAGDAGEPDAGGVDGSRPRLDGGTRIDGGTRVDGGTRTDASAADGFDIEIVIAGPTGSATAGEAFEWNGRAIDHGPDATTSTMAFIPIPAGLTIAFSDHCEVIPRDWHVEAPVGDIHGVRCVLGPLGAGEQASFVLRILSSARGTYSSHAAALGYLGTELDYGNNFADVTTTVE